MVEGTDLNKSIGVQKNSKKQAREAAAHAHRGKPRPQPSKDCPDKSKTWEKEQEYKKPERHAYSDYPEKHYHDAHKDENKNRDKPNLHYTYPGRHK